MAVFLLSFGTGASAAEVDVEKAIQLIDAANNEIYALIDAAKAEADVLKGNYLATVAGLEEGSDAYVSATVNYNAELDKLIGKLDEETVKLSNKTVEEAAKLGVQAECEWIPVEIGDRVVLIDPIIVQWD